MEGRVVRAEQVLRWIKVLVVSTRWEMMVPVLSRLFVVEELDELEELELDEGEVKENDEELELDEGVEKENDEEQVVDIWEEELDYNLE